MARSSSRPRRSPTDVAAPAASVRARALLVIDNRPLQREAWAEFHSARKRHDKAAHDLHRHEEIDMPAYQSWISRTFPVFVTALRELHEEVFNKARRVEMVQAMASLTGRSPKKLWREQKEYEANPEKFEDDFDRDETSEESEGQDETWRDEDDDFSKRDEKSGQRSWNFDDDVFEPGARKRKPADPAGEIKNIYRRLVQHLHPDRGGEWTATRKRLWHEVQQAWAAGDGDWLARLEIEWETANDVLGPTSPLSRLRRAIEELHAARRDTERKLREYRTSPPWRFTLSEKKREVLHRRTETNFQHDIEFLRRQLAYLNATIAAWENDDRPSIRRRSSRRSRRPL